MLISKIDVGAHDFTGEIGFLRLEVGYVVLKILLKKRQIPDVNTLVGCHYISSWKRA
jgi:hypothetical protein